MTLENFEAMPLLGFRVVQNPEMPTTPILVMRNAKGVAGYLVTREMLEKMGAELQQIASSVPRKADQN
jgi:hypothetical protein